MLKMNYVKCLCCIKYRFRKSVLKICFAFMISVACLLPILFIKFRSTFKETLNVKIYSPGSKYDQPNANRIYFHETTKRTRLNVRQSCAVESAAKNNPNKLVQLFMLYTSDFDYSSPWLRVLSRYSNIEIVLLKEDDYFANTPLEDWLKKAEWQSSPFKVAHLADYLRMLSAVKGGGLYLDMDILTLKAYDEITKNNFFALEDSKANIICNSVFNLNSTHRFVNEIIAQLAEDYDPTAWAYHGSDVIMAIMKNKCGFKKAKSPITNKCPDIDLLGYKSFFALEPAEFFLMFKSATNYSLNLFNESYGVHIWNSKTRHDFLDLSTSQLYSVLARKHCPLTVKQATHCPYI